jgi:hypothetical protein
MKNDKLLVVGVVAGLFLGGCGKGGKPPAAVKLEDVPQTMEKAFGKNTKPEVTEQVNKAVADLQQRNPDALQELHEISSKSEMTPEQRSAVATSMAAYMKHLQEESEKGNKKAKEALDNYIATK